MISTDLNGRTVLVSAGAGEIGKTVCRIFAKNNAKLAICDGNLSAAQKLADSIQSAGGTAKAYLLDIRKKETFASLCEQIVSDLGSIDILINNEDAIVIPEERKTLENFNNDLYDDIIKVRLQNFFHFSKAAVQDMAHRKNGCIINVTSALGLIPAKYQTPAVIASAGEMGFTAAWAMELANKNIRVNAIACGMMKTEKTAPFLDTEEKVAQKLTHLAVKRLGTGEDVAYTALFLASDAASYITSAVIPVDGGYSTGFIRNF